MKGIEPLLFIQRYAASREKPSQTEVGAALPVVPELLLLGGDDVEVLRDPDEDLRGGQELAARAAQGEHVLEERHLDVGRNSRTFVL